MSIAQQFLKDAGVAAEDLDQIANDAQQEMAVAYETAATAPWPDNSLVASDVQDVGGAV